MTHLHLLQVNLEDGGELSHVSVLIDADKDLVEQSLKVVSLHSVHHESLGVGQGVWLISLNTSY